MHAREWFAVLVLTVAGSSVALGQVKQSALERGFAPDKLYAFADVDSIDLSSGTVALRIPIGPRYPAGGSLSYGLTLTYSSNVWDFEQRESFYQCGGPPPEYCPIVYTQAFPNMVNNAGLGWMLSMGRLGTPGTDNNPLGSASVFISPDGSQHQFFPRLHRSDPDTSTFDGLSTYSFTRDGSYLRMKFRTDVDTVREVQLGDGTIYTFGIWYPQPGHTDWRLTSIRDPFGNQVTVTYPTGTNNWVITDGQGRTTTVYFISRQQDGQSVLFADHVDVASFNGTTATYSFQYTGTVISRSCNDGDPETSATLGVSLLAAVVLPDNTSYSMSNYATACGLGAEDLTGILGKLVLPTGGSIDWTYQRWAYSATSDITGCMPNPPLEDCVNKIRLDWAGIASRTVTDPYGASSGTWSYATAVVWKPNPLVPIVPLERRTLVSAPTGDDTVYYFRALPDATLNQTADNDPDYDYWDYALPYTTRDFIPDPVTGKHGYLSVESYQGQISGSLTDIPITAPAGALKRTVRVLYEHDQFDPARVNDIDEDYRSTNRALIFRRTTYLDDGNKYADEKFFDFDGLGHYRSTVTDGNFDASNVHKVYRNTNPARLTYKVSGNQLDTSSQDWYTSLSGTESPANSFEMIAATSPWILTTFDVEQDVEGNVVARREFCFEGSTGFLQRTRTVSSNNGSPGANDLLAVYSRDTAGNLTSEQSYGGDTQSIATGTLCSLTPPSTNQYRIDHTYQYGSRKTSRYADASGTPLSFSTLDLDIDRNTGLPSVSRDTASLATDYVYDSMGRLTWEKPRTTPVNGGAWVNYVYTAFSGSNPATADIYRRPNGSTTGVLARETYAFDGFGRPFREYRLLSTGAWNQRLTTYNAMGWKTAVSEWQQQDPAVVKNTEYKDFDPFGRPTTITPPDGATHNVTLAYLGARQLTRTAYVATSTTSESAVPTVEIYDRQGRLYRITEKSGLSGADTTTTYAYDIGGRLTQASTPSGTTTQSRVFTYDNRGLLTAERLPEKGATGNGFVYYSAYDARGHAGRIADGPNDLSFDTDRAERLWRVRETGGNQRTLKSLTFATANGGGDYANGKLWLAVANNYYDLANPTNNFLAQETYTYGGVGGRVSQRSTLAGIVGANQGTFVQSFTWNDLGMPATVTYPQLAGVGPARTVTFDLTNGWLTRVREGATNYASSISYHSNGMVNQVVHPNNTTDTYAKDANDLQRPASVTVRGPLGLTLWTTNAYAYDGSGNVKAMGTDTFTYDLVSRLVEGKIVSVSKKQCMAYDAFGNVLRADAIASTGTCQTTPAISIDPATNRMNYLVAYDTAGEQTSWSSGQYQYAWYPTGQMRQFDGSGRSTIHGYTADGERVGTYDSYAPAGITYTLRGLHGKVLRTYRESGGVWSWVQDYVDRGGASLATIDSTGTRHFALDHLGTVRLITNASGSQVALHTYLPFGQEGTNAYQDTERMKFTGHERDLRDTSVTTDDLDDMHARYYNPIVGRFLSVDPGRDVDPKVPQAWNMYAYARGNPMKYVDADGRFIDTVLDTGFIAMDVADIAATLLAGERTTKTQWAALGGDIVGALIPFATGVGATVRHLSKLEDLGKVATRLGELVKEGKVVTREGLALRPDLLLAGGRSGEKVKELVGPANSILRGRDGRIFVTNERGQVILDITKERVKPVIPGEGFGRKRPPTEQEGRWMWQVDNLAGQLSKGQR